MPTYSVLTYCTDLITSVVGVVDIYENRKQESLTGVSIACFNSCYFSFVQKAISLGVESARIKVCGIGTGRQVRIVAENLGTCENNKFTSCSNET